MLMSGRFPELAARYRFTVPPVNDAASTEWMSHQYPSRGPASSGRVRNLDAAVSCPTGMPGMGRIAAHARCAFACCCSSTLATRPRLADSSAMTWSVSPPLLPLLLGVACSARSAAPASVRLPCIGARLGREVDHCGQPRALARQGPGEQPVGEEVYGEVGDAGASEQAEEGHGPVTPDALFVFHAGSLPGWVPALTVILASRYCAGHDTISGGEDSCRAGVAEVGDRASDTAGGEIHGEPGCEVATCRSERQARAGTGARPAGRTPRGRLGRTTRRAAGSANRGGASVADDEAPQQQEATPPEDEGSGHGDPTLASLDGRLDRLESMIENFISGGSGQQAEAPDIKAEVRAAVREVQAKDKAKADKETADAAAAQSIEDRIKHLEHKTEDAPMEYRPVTNFLGWAKP